MQPTRQRIRASKATETKAWAKALGCTVAELRVALRAVGDSTERVRTYLSALRGAGTEATDPPLASPPVAAPAARSSWPFPTAGGPASDH